MNMAQTGLKLREQMEQFLGNVPFLIRLRADRGLLYRGRRLSALAIAARCRLTYAEALTRHHADGEEEKFTVTFGFRPVKLPGYERQLYLVVVRGFGREPLMRWKGRSNTAAGGGRKVRRLG